MSTKNRIVCGLSSAESAPALQRTFELARDRDWTPDAVHAVNLPGGLFGLVEADALSRARAGALDQLAGVMEPFGGVEALGKHLRVEAGSPGKVLADAAEEAARLVLGEHVRQGATDLFGNTTRTLVAGAGCPVWLQRGAYGPVRRVVGAVDLGEAGKHTIALARQEAQAFGAELQLVHVFDLTQIGTVFGYEVPLPATAWQASRTRAMAEFDELVGEFDWSGDWEGRHGKSFIDGEPVKELLALNAGADLTVLGTHGHGAFARTVIGSVASKVLDAAQRPVLVHRVTD